MKQTRGLRVVPCLILAGALCGTCLAQAIDEDVAPRPFKIQIHHADPWVVKALIEGFPVQAPEISTLPGFAGLVSRGVGQAMSLLKNGFLVVNPTDNSLWYYPKRRTG